MKEIGTWHHLDLKLRFLFIFFTYNKNGKTSCLLIGNVGRVGRWGLFPSSFLSIGSLEGLIIKLTPGRLTGEK